MVPTIDPSIFGMLSSSGWWRILHYDYWGVVRNVCKDGILINVKTSSTDQKIKTADVVVNGK